MSTQFDSQSGFDISGLITVSKAQLMAMVNQIAPLANIGGVITGSGAAGAHPDVTNNPRFIRYIWLDTQTDGSVLIKVYQGSRIAPTDTYADWATITIADSSITAAKIANYAVSILNGTGASKIAYKQDGSADGTQAYYILRLNASGQFVEVTPLSTMVADLTLNPRKLDVTGATDGTVLTYSSSLGYAVFQAVSLSSIISAGSINYDRLANATPSFILRANPLTGVIEAVSNNDTTSTLFPVRSIAMSKLSTLLAAAQTGVRYNVTTNTFETVLVTHTSNDTVMQLDTKVINAEAHGLGGIPTGVQLWLVNKANNGGAGYTVGDIVPVSSFFCSTGNQMIASLTLKFATPQATFDVTTLADNAGGDIVKYPSATGTALVSSSCTNLIADWNIRAVLTRIST